MARNIITAANSRATKLLDTDRFASLLVTADGYIAAYDVAYESQGGNAIATIKGTVLSDASYGIVFSGDTNTLNVAMSGLVQGDYGLYSEGDYTSVRNEGTIASSTPKGDGIDIYGSYAIVENSGLISGFYGMFIVGAATRIDNSGVIQSPYAVYNSGDATIVNSGSIRGQILCFGTMTLRNTGAIDGNVFGSASTDSITNSGQMRYASLGGGTDVLLNLTGGVIVTGVVMGVAGDGSDTADSVSNSGLILGYVGMGNGDDTVDTSNGRIDGVVFLDEGNDTYTGGDGADRVVGGAGADTIDLGGGNDQYRAVNGDGKDDIDGGDGNDTYNASACTLSVGVDLSAATSSLTVGNDLILDFENIIGGSANDTLTGSDDGNRIDGGAGSDILGGGDGNDRILGGAGTDTITGGLGRDVLTGGTATGLNEADKFVFSDGDSGTKAATRDVITDFTDHGSASAPYATGADTIDLHLIDANTVTAANQAFSFNSVSGAAFSGVAGSLIWLQTGQFALVLGDTDGDSKADFVIQLNGVHALLASDFVL